MRIHGISRPAWKGCWRRCVQAHSRVASLLLVSLLTSGGAWGQSTTPDPQLRSLLLSAVAESASFEDRFDAEVWLTDMSSRLSRQMPDTAERLEFLRLLHGEAARAELPAELVLAVIEVESAFDRFAISHAGALGLMQVMPFWLEEIGRPGDNLFEVQTNLRFGCTILKYYLDMEKGNLINALGRYNGSLGRMKYPNKVLKALNRRWYRS